MENNQYSVPIVLFLYNRKSTTRRIFEKIRQIKPATLFLIADGPNLNKADALAKVDETRKSVEIVDWECNVFREYAEVNMGCDKRIETGLNYVFQRVDRAIILEDDCLPNSSFFQFCEEMLEFYKNDNNIMYVSGTNILGEDITTNDFFFSKRADTWGWATWKRAWDYYPTDVNEFWNHIKTSGLIKTHRGSYIGKKFIEEVESNFSKGIYPWDYIWQSLVQSRNGLGIVPSKNLIENIGFGDDATHTNNKPSYYSGKVTELKFPLQYPVKVEACKLYDKRRNQQIFCISLLTRILRRLKINKNFSNN